MTNKQKLGGFRGLGRRILILEQYAKRIVITNHHTKFQPDSSKRLEVIQSWNVKKRWGRTDDTHPGANYSRRRNLFRRRQQKTGRKRGRADIMARSWKIPGSRKCSLIRVRFHEKTPIPRVRVRFRSWSGKPRFEGLGGFGRMSSLF